MSTTFIQTGDVLTLTAPSGGVVAGVPVLIGAQLVVPTDTVAQTLLFSGHVVGVHALPKVGSQAWTEGEKIYWDDGNTRLTSVATAGPLAGIAAEAVGSGSGATTGKIRLNESVPSAAAGSQAAEADLVAASGTANGTIVDVGGSFSQATLNDNFQDVATKINAILAKLRLAGIIAP